MRIEIFQHGVYSPECFKNLNLARINFNRTGNYGKNFLKIGRFEPSSKTCSHCGYVNHSLTLNDREWTCPRL